MPDAILRMGLECGECGSELLQYSSGVMGRPVKCTNSQCAEYGKQYLVQPIRVPLIPHGTGPRDA